MWAAFLPLVHRPWTPPPLLLVQVLVALPLTPVWDQAPPPLPLVALPLPLVAQPAATLPLTPVWCQAPPPLPLVAPSLPLVRRPWTQSLV